MWRQVKFRSSNSGPKRVAEEEIIEVEDLSGKLRKVDDTSDRIESRLSIGTFKKPQINRSGQKSTLANLVKRKTTATATATTTSTATVTSKPTNNGETTSSAIPPSVNLIAPKPISNTSNGLSLLSGYDNNTDSDDSE